MSLLRDLVYALGLLITTPVWLWYLIRTGKGRTEWAARFGRTHLSPVDRPTILIHAVSVGEVNAIRGLVERLNQRYRDDARIVISATTNTGIARARQLYEARNEVVRYPFDFTFAVSRFLDRIQPDVVALVELEVWPNFVAACRRRDVPVIVINGRLSEHSYRGYRRFRFVVKGMFGRLTRACVQDEAYAERFRGLGTPDDRVDVTGTMKWDNAVIVNDRPGAQPLAQAMGIPSDLPRVVCGSTGMGEEALLREALAGLTDGAGRPVQLLMAPRKPERFEEAAAALSPCTRRSQPGASVDSPRFLLDTLGELADAYVLADVVVVGRTFSDQGGSDMIEPIALGKPVVVGPHTENFADATRRLLEGDGIVQVQSAKALRGAVEHLLHNHDRAAALASNGRAVIRANQGATERHAAMIESLVAQRSAR